MDENENNKKDARQIAELKELEKRIPSMSAEELDKAKEAVRKKLIEAGASEDELKAIEAAATERAAIAAGRNPVLSYLTSDRLPRMILRTFQWLLIVQWIMGWEPFGHLPLYMVFLPIIVNMVFAVVWPPQELKDAISKAKRDAGLE